MSDITITRELLEKIAKLPRMQREAYMKEVGRVEWQRCAEDPLYWLDPTKHVVPYVYTVDERSLYVCKACKDPITYSFDKLEFHLLNTHKIEGLSAYELQAKFTELPRKRPFPILPYMPPLVDVWLKKKLVAIEKSRDMMATWLYVALYTWDTYFHPHRKNVFQSQVGGQANEIVQRAFYLVDNQPKFLKRLPYEFKEGASRSGEFIVAGGLNKGGSEILGFPQGPNQVRGLHPSGILVDEAAFQVEAEAAFGAIKPAINAGGRCTLLSSANPGWFQAVCRDKLENYGI